MSNPFEIPLLPPDDEEVFQRAPEGPPVVQAAPSGARSSLDELLDRVADTREPVRKTWKCQCGSLLYRMVSPVEGGVTVRICRKCRREEPIANKATPAMIAPPGFFPQMGGPHYGTAAPPRNLLMTQPRYRWMGLSPTGDNDDIK